MSSKAWFRSPLTEYLRALEAFFKHVTTGPLDVAYFVFPMAYDNPSPPFLSSCCGCPSLSSHDSPLSLLSNPSQSKSSPSRPEAPTHTTDVWLLPNGTSHHVIRTPNTSVSDTLVSLGVSPDTVYVCTLCHVVDPRSEPSGQTCVFEVLARLVGGARNSEPSSSPNSWPLFPLLATRA